MAEPQLRRMRQDEFLAWQEHQDRLYELVDGIPVLPLKMMTGASQAHDRVVVNIIAALHRQLRGTPCRPTTDDLAVRVPAGNVRRPDVAVECGQAERRELAVREPRVVIEVLSPSTMSFGRISKAAGISNHRLGCVHSPRRYRETARRCAVANGGGTVCAKPARWPRCSDRSSRDPGIAQSRRRF
jgi:Putative restriction endonuclease